MDNQSGGDSKPKSGPFSHVYVCPDALPKATDTPEAFIQRITLLANELDSLGRGAWQYLVGNAPVLLHSDVGVFLIGIGYLAQGIELVGRQMLERFGMEPIDPLEDQKRLIREQVAKPDCDPELREHLLGWLGRLNDLPSAEVEIEEWPDIVQGDLGSTG